jgi:hypothetical protein
MARTKLTSQSKNLCLCLCFGGWGATATGGETAVVMNRCKAETALAREALRKKSFTSETFSFDTADP